MLQRQLGNLLYSIGDCDGEYVSGTVNGVVGALATSLLIFVIDLQIDKKKYRGQVKEIRAIKSELYDFIDRFLDESEKDAHAYNYVTQAKELPSSSETDRENRQSSLDSAYIRASQPQREIMQLARDLIKVYEKMEALKIQGTVVADLKVSLNYLREVTESSALIAQSNYQQISSKDLRDVKIADVTHKKEQIKEKIRQKEANISYYLKNGQWGE